MSTNSFVRVASLTLVVCTDMPVTKPSFSMGAPYVINEVVKNSIVSGCGRPPINARA